MKRLLPILLVSLALACARTEPAPTHTVRPWNEMVPAVVMRTGDGPREIDIAAYIGDTGAVVSVTALGGGDLDPVDIEVVPSAVDGRPTSLRMTADGDASAMRFAEVEVLDGSGTTERFVLVVEYHHVPQAEFRYEPESPGTRTVSVAGSFNGWNAGADPLAGPGPDGAFTASVSVTPGRHTYKYVVDGAWITDPGNPVSEPDGFGGNNSILVVEGTTDAEGAFQLLPVPALGSTADAVAFHAAGASGDLHPVEGVVVMAGNRVVGTMPAAGGAALVDIAVVGNSVVVSELDAITPEIAPDGIVRVMAHDDEGTWTEATLYREPAEWMQPDWRGRSIYFAFIDRFADGDGMRPEIDRADEIMPAANYHGGDWAGLQQKIEEGYFDQMGVESLWISAVNRQPPGAALESVPPHDLYTGYHGYWPVSATETNTAFGTMDALKQLVSTAHEHDILVLFDLVTNHVHEDHPWYQQHPEWFGELKLPGGEDNLRKFDEYPFTTWFETFLPSFDYENNPEAVHAVADNAIWWIEQTGIDGFRQDAVKHVQTVFWRHLTRQMRDQIEVPEGRRLYQVGETISGRGTIMEFVSGEMLDGQFDFPLYWTIRDSLGSQSRGLGDLAREIETSAKEYDPESIMSPLIGNHDVSRFMAFADGDLGVGQGIDEKALGREASMTVGSTQAYERLKLAHALLMTLPGNPMLYYGDEIGLTGAGDPDNRRPMRFGDDLTDAERGVLENLRELGPLRTATPALRLGHYQTLVAGDAILAYARVLSGRGSAPDQAVIVVINREDGEAAVTVPLPMNLAHATQAVTLYQGRGLPDGTINITGGTLRVTVPPGTAWIGELR